MSRRVEVHFTKLIRQMVELKGSSSAQSAEENEFIRFHSAYFKSINMNEQVPECKPHCCGTDGFINNIKFKLFSSLSDDR